MSLPRLIDERVREDFSEEGIFKKRCAWGDSELLGCLGKKVLVGGQSEFKEQETGFCLKCCRTEWNNKEVGAVSRYQMICIFATVNEWCESEIMQAKPERQSVAFCWNGMAVRSSAFPPRE